MSKVPDSLDPVDIAVAAHDSGKEHVEAMMRAADVSISYDEYADSIYELNRRTLDPIVDDIIDGNGETC
jgi:tricorn protease-like protein